MARIRGIRVWQIVAWLALSLHSAPCASPSAPAPLHSGLYRENATYGVDFWRESDGFSQSRVRAIVQTRDGYVWLGTDGGLVRFDGESFTAFTTQTGALRDNEVWALQEDDQGGLWAGTYGGGLTLFKDGRFRTFTTADGLPDDVVVSLAKDLRGDIWVITPQGLARASHGVLTRFGRASGLPEAGVLAVCGAAPGGVLVATRGGLFRSAGSGFEPLPPTGEYGVPGRLACGSDGSVWVGYSSGAIERRLGGASKIFPSPPGAPGPVSHIYEDPGGGIWAVLGRRIARLRNGAFETVPVEGGAAALGPVYTLCMDREGGIWVGLRSNGLARLRTRQITTLSVDDGLPDDRTLAVFEDRAGGIWVGTADGLARYHDGRFAVWHTVNGSRLGDVRSIAGDSAGTVWVSSGKDLFWMRDGRLSPVPNWACLFEIEVLYSDAAGRMWVATDGAGLFQYSHGMFRNFRSADGLAGDHIRGLMSDRSGALWISASGKGVSRYLDGKFTTFTTRDGLAGDRVVAMHEDEEGAIWFAARRGLSRLKDGAFFTWRNSGLPTDFVYSIVDDGRGSFWFSSALGLFRVAKRELRDFAAGRLKRVSAVAYGEKDGLKTRAGNVGNQPTALRSAAGELLFTSMKGLVVVEPGRLLPDTFVPPVYIEQVIVNRKDQPPGRFAQLPLGAGEIEIHYAAPCYSDPGKLRFRYLLEGFDGDWIDAGGRRFTHYANLSPGSYRFRVVAGVAGGAWNETGASFAFDLRPPFYRTPLFAAAAALSALLFAWLLYWLRMRGLKARYSAVLAERSRISRDIHDTLAQNLAGIALQLDAVRMQLPAVDGPLGKRLDEACNLTRYSLAEARRAISGLRSDGLECPELSAALPEIARRVAGDLETRVVVSGSPRKLNPTMESNLLRIFQEALTNAVKHAHARTIEVELRYEPAGLALRVRDDGRGFNPQTLGAVEGGHYGLIGMRERAERIGGRFTLNSQPGEGTEMLVEVPT